MFNILLYVGQQEQNLELIFWALGILVAIILLVALVWQRRTGNELEEELQQLETQKHKEVEFDFVLKAMGMSVWHLNVDTGEVFYDKDFREKHTDFVEATEGDTYDESADLLVEEDAVRVRFFAGVVSEHPIPRRFIGRRAMPSSPIVISTESPFALWAPACALTAVRIWRLH